VTTQGWTLLNLGSIIPMSIIVLALIWLGMQRKQAVSKPL
jgi:hypothetical protein